MSYRYLALFISTLLCCSSLTVANAEAPATPTQPTSEPIEIGALLCLTGDCATWGNAGLAGAKLAVAELNASGGILGRQIQLVTQDSADTTPAATVSGFRALAQQSNPALIIGPTWTVGGMSIAPLVARMPNLTVISPSVGLKEFNETSDNIFNTWPHDEVATRALAQYARKQQWSSVAIFGSQDPFYVTQSEIFAEEFTRLGGTVVVRVEPLPNAVDLRTEALQVKKAKPDCIMVTNYQADFIALALDAVQSEAPLLAVQMEHERVAAAKGALENTVFAMYAKPQPAFIEAFQNKFNRPPGISADTAYDAVKIFAAAAEAVGSLEAKKVQAQLRITKNFRGASGLFSMNELGAVDRKPVLWRVVGTQYRPVDLN